MSISCFMLGLSRSARLDRSPFAPLREDGAGRLVSLVSSCVSIVLSCGSHQLR
jgi:hypothetical protein